MTYTDTKSQAKKRYTLREVQATAKTYDLLIQPINANSRAPYGIFFDGQLVAEVKKLADAVEIFPSLYRAIQEQLAEQQKATTPTIEEAIAASDEACTEDSTFQSLVGINESTASAGASTSFSYQAYEDTEAWELRDRLNEQGYRDAIAHLPPLHNTGPYMAGYSRGVRDRPLPV